MGGAESEKAGGARPAVGGPRILTPKGDDSPEACEAGRRRCGYHGEAAGSSHRAQAPKHCGDPDPPRAGCASAASRRMRPLRRAVCAGSV